MIIVEDGTIVSGANSYASVDDFKTYADLRGVTYGTDAAIEILLIKAMDVIESKADLFKGDKQTSAQALQWPRYNVYIDGFYSTGIPKQLIYGQLALAVESATQDLQPTIGQGTQKRVKVDVIEVEYEGARQTSIFSKAEAHLTALYRNGGLFSVNANVTRV